MALALQKLLQTATRYQAAIPVAFRGRTTQSTFEALCADVSIPAPWVRYEHSVWQRSYAVRMQGRTIITLTGTSDRHYRDALFLYAQHVLWSEANYHGIATFAPFDSLGWHKDAAYFWHRLYVHLYGDTHLLAG